MNAHIGFFDDGEIDESFLEEIAKLNDNTVAVELVSGPSLKPYEPLALLGSQKLAWKYFKWAVEALAKAEFGPAGLKTFYAATDAYRELYDSYVNKRIRTKTEGKDESLEYWAQQKSDFRTVFFGIDEGSWLVVGKDRKEWKTRDGRLVVVETDRKKWKAKRRWKGCSPEIVKYMTEYQSLWDAWWPHTPRGSESKQRSNHKQAKREPVKLAKAAANKTEQAKAGRKKAKLKARQVARQAKGQAEQALYDSWATEAVVEEVLRDV